MLLPAIHLPQGSAWWLCAGASSSELHCSSQPSMVKPRCTQHVLPLPVGLWLGAWDPSNPVQMPSHLKEWETTNYRTSDGHEPHSASSFWPVSLSGCCTCPAAQDPRAPKGSQGSAPCPQPLPAPCPHLMPVLASDAHAHAVANSGVSSDGNYGGMSSTVISALGTCHHSAIMGCWDGTEAEGEGGLERGPRLPTGDQYMSPGWSARCSGILAWQKSQKESAHALFHTS